MRLGVGFLGLVLMWELGFGIFFRKGTFHTVWFLSAQLGFFGTRICHFLYRI